jgi:hypothetical protein
MLENGLIDMRIMPKVSSVNMTPFFLPEAEFMDVIVIKILRVSSLLFTITFNRFYFPTTLEQKLFVNIVNENLKCENSQDYAQKPQQNYTFMNSASVQDQSN